MWHGALDRTNEGCGEELMSLMIVPACTRSIYDHASFDKSVNAFWAIEGATYKLELECSSIAIRIIFPMSER